VAQDNNLATWNAYGNAYWPADYLIDAKGRVRYVHFGEGDYDRGELAVRSLLAEAGADGLGGLTHPALDYPVDERVTPETYLGAARAVGFVHDVVAGTHDYGALPHELPDNALAYGGRWRISSNGATAGNGAGLELNFTARHVYLVLGSAGGARPLRVYLDGRPITAGSAGDDVHGGVASVRSQRLYKLVDLPRVEQHTLRLRFAPGTSGYAFTFG
jgi:hypothetical protein